MTGGGAGGGCETGPGAQGPGAQGTFSLSPVPRSKPQRRTPTQTRKRPRPGAKASAGLWSSPPHNSPLRRGARPAASWRAAHSWAPRDPPVARAAAAPGQRPPSYWQRGGPQAPLGPSLLGGHLLRSGPGVLRCLETPLPRLPLGPQRPGPADTLQVAAGWGPRAAEQGSGAEPWPGPQHPQAIRDDKARRGWCTGTPALWTRAPFRSFSSVSLSCSRHRDTGSLLRCT